MNKPLICKWFSVWFSLGVVCLTGGNLQATTCLPAAKLAAIPTPLTSTRPNGATTAIYDLKTIKIHAYIAPKPALRTSTYVIESPTKLVVIEPQFMNTMAKDFRSYINSLGKPIARVLVTDRDPDHYFGLAAAFTEVPAYALPSVIEVINRSGPPLLEERKKMFGTEMPQTQLAPSHTLKMGAETIDCVTYRFEALPDDEGGQQIVVHLPEYGVIASGDIVANRVHLVPGPATTAHLQEFAQAAKSYKLVLPSNGMPADSKLFAENLAYLATVAQNLPAAKDAEDYQKRMLQAYPDYDNAIYFNFYVPAYFAKKK